MSILGSFFPTGKTVGPRGPSQCGTLLAWGTEMQSECSHSSFSPSEVLLGLYGLRFASASPLVSGIFTMVFCLWIVASCSCEGDWERLKWEQPMLSYWWCLNCFVILPLYFVILPLHFVIPNIGPQLSGVAFQDSINTLHFAFILFASCAPYPDSQEGSTY